MIFMSRPIIGAGGDALPAATCAYSPAAGFAQNGGMNSEYAVCEPSRAEIDALEGPAILEFGAPWCGWCRGAQPLIAAALASHPGVHHLKIEDGSGKPLGRSFGIKLWPTLVFLMDGRELARLVRPQDAGVIDTALQALEMSAGVSR
jgi:thioredoxin 1